MRQTLSLKKNLRTCQRAAIFLASLSSSSELVCCFEFVTCPLSSFFSSLISFLTLLGFGCWRKESLLTSFSHSQMHSQSSASSSSEQRKKGKEGEFLSSQNSRISLQDSDGDNHIYIYINSVMIAYARNTNGTEHIHSPGLAFKLKIKALQGKGEERHDDDFWHLCVCIFETLIQYVLESLLFLDESLHPA